ncbi:MAG: aldo/keto reductase [Eggerthellaceae bacterium]
MNQIKHPSIPTTKIEPGIQMPMLGFGVYQVPDANQCEQAVVDAIQAGYRLIDTAAAYFNEEAVGSGIARSSVRREDLFITSKVWVQDAGYAATIKAFKSSLMKLGLDYLDLYLIHHPLGDYWGSWRAMDELQRAGLIRAIGVCNFTPARLADLAIGSGVTPSINQIEVHPFFQRENELAAMRELGVQPESWGPFAEGKHGIFTNKTLCEIGKAHKKTAAQVALRWNLQRGSVVLAKSVKAERMAENLAVCDFELSTEEMNAISSLDLGTSSFVGHESIESVRMRHEFKVHE